MSKKHFEQLARALVSCKPDYGVATYGQWMDDVSAVAGVCAANNPQFDREWFRRACGVQ